jgi:GntR family transcriptional regulator of arabinose operon
VDKPKYRDISERLSRDILAGKYQPGQRFPSEAALVKRFGASRITIGHALRELQQQALIDRVAGSGTFVRGAAGRERKELLFGLIIPNLGETEIFEPICQAIAASPDSNSHALLWPHADPAADRETEALRLAEQCIERRVSGVFFAPLELAPQSKEVNHRVMAALKKAGAPVVLLDRRPNENPGAERCDLVGIDNHRAGYIAAQHLLNLGAQRLGFFAYRNQAGTVRERIRGYRDALSAQGEAPERIIHIAATGTAAIPPAALECDAFVCSNDRIAGQLMHALIARGIRIPQDVRIAGIDDVTYASLLPVPLTTVHQPCREIGEAALRAMLERLDRRQMAARDILLDCSLVVRQSCGAFSTECRPSVVKLGTEYNQK